MALNSKTIQRITGNTADDIVNNNKHMGLDTTTFAERQQINKNRSIIQSYRHSGLGQRVIASRANIPQKTEVEPVAEAAPEPSRPTDPNQWSTDISPSEAAWEAMMDRSKREASTSVRPQRQDTASHFARPSEKQGSNRFATPSRLGGNGSLATPSGGNRFATPSKQSGGQIPRSGGFGRH